MTVQEKLKHLNNKGRTGLKEKGGYWSGYWTGTIGGTSVSFVLEK